MQIQMLPKGQKSYGGELLKTRKGRKGPRSISSKYSMHLVLRSSKAKGQLSFRTKKNRLAIRDILNKFSAKYSVKVLSLANVGNHLHIQIRLQSRHTYKAFIRAITGAITMAVSGFNRWNKAPKGWKFWDYRPFSRIVSSFKEYLNLKDYIAINRLEGFGYKRNQAEMIIREGRRKRGSPLVI